MLRSQLLKEVNGGYEEVRRMGKGVEGVKGEDFELQAWRP